MVFADDNYSGGSLLETYDAVTGAFVPYVGVIAKRKHNSHGFCPVMMSYLSQQSSSHCCAVVLFCHSNQRGGSGYSFAPAVWLLPEDSARRKARNQKWKVFSPLTADR